MSELSDEIATVLTKWWLPIRKSPVMAEDLTRLLGHLADLFAGPDLDGFYRLRAK